MQVFIAIGYVETQSGGSDFEDVRYVYPFTDPDEAMLFVEYASEHKDDVDRWEIVTETVRSARTTYDNHRKWVEG